MVELMVATTLSMLLVAGALKLLAQGQASLNTAENLVALEERAAFVLALLEDDVRLAGYWGLHSEGHRLSVPDAIEVHCRGREVSDWALRPEQPVASSNGVYDLPCPPGNEAMPGTDTLTVRHASAAAVEPRPATIQIETDHLSGSLLETGTPTNFSPSAHTHNMQVHAWYIDRSSSEQGLPALRRYALVHGRIMQDQEIMPGIEDLQVWLGVDTDDNGITDAFVEPDAADGNTIRSIRLYLRLLAPQWEPGNIDTYFGTWLGSQDGRRRLEVDRTIVLRNRAAT
jgi:type IV pilus assembly protein PilW